MDKEDLMFQTIGELKESNRVIAQSMVNIDSNLKILNDHNILHAEKTTQEHTSLLDLAKEQGTKHWYLIVALIVIILGIMGYKELAVTTLIP